MSQCLRGNGPCEATAVFCEECRSLLQAQFNQGSVSPALEQDPPAFSGEHSPAVSSMVQEGDPSHLATHSYPLARAPETPPPPVLPASDDVVEQAISRLNEAAQRIAEGEPVPRRLPRASRLAPIRDISAEIQRASTPLPQVSNVRNGKNNGQRTAPFRSSWESKPRSANQENGTARRNSDAELPDLGDLWPWLDGEDEKESDDTWANRTDPLISRHFPTSAESARIEEEDIKRAMADGVVTAPLPPLTVKGGRSRSSPVRIAFIALVILAVVAIAIDTVLLSVAFIHPRHPAGTQSGLPTLTLSSNQVNLPAKPVLYINNFMPGTSVSLTHDIDEPVKTSSDSSIISIGASGSAQTTIVVDNDWGPGLHLIVAEDIKTRFTASASLQVIGSAPTPPPHLSTDKAMIDLGTDFVGANTIKYLLLSNTGGGSITWSASSNQPWLLISPSQGMFSDKQTIAIAGQRANLKPGAYTGTITLSSNVGPSQPIKVVMGVQPLPPNAGPVLALSPAVLSFTATDGGDNPRPQALSISNPGSQQLNWSLTANSWPGISTPVMPSPIAGKADWLSTGNILFGAVFPGSTTSIPVYAQSRSLLPGVYMGILVFMANGAIDSPQTVVVSLTVQPHCGLVTSSGGLSFTAVQGQNNPSNQTLSLTATASCAGGALNWQAQASKGWLAVTPTSGQLKGTLSNVVSVGVNAAGLEQGDNHAVITFTASQSTQTVGVQLLVQPPPLPTAPILGISPLTLNFSNTQGQPNPTGQVVTITNNGGSILKWNTIAKPLSSSWLNTNPSGGIVAPKQTGQVTVNVDTSKLTPGNYVGQITINGTDASGHNPASGSPQIITVNLVLQPPCALTQPSSSSLTFSMVQGASNPAPQTVTFTATGSCAWPLNWSAHAPSNAPWLALLPPTAGQIKGTGQSGSIGIGVNAGALGVGTYSAQVSITATDSTGAVAQGSPQMVTVTLTILQPCVLQPLPANLSFSAVQGQSSNVQTLTVSDTGGCAPSVTWTASGDANSSSWLVISPPSGTDSGSGSTINVSANAANLAPGTYSGTITVTATSGVPVQGSPQPVTVTLTVTGFTVSGTVLACAGPAPSCPNPVPLPGATLTLVNGSGTTIATATADASGNYAFSGLALGGYTVKVSGTDSNGTHYAGSIPLTVSGNATGVNVQVFPG